MPCCFALFALYACSASRKQPGCGASPLELLLHESEPARLSRASPVGVNRAGPVTGLTRFHVIIPFVRFHVYVTLRVARLPSQPGYRASSHPCNHGLTAVSDLPNAKLNE